jgi:uncharacterized hydrophobic protein (TIGR00271 family)
MPASLGERIAGEARTPDEIREAVYLFTGDVAAKQSRFWLLLILATAIATAGVIGDSTPTVIGAMIIAPLAIPIQGAAVAVAYGELRSVLLCAGTVAASIVVVVGLSALIAFILPELKPLADNSQVTARSAPTLIDLAAATATGLAGAFAIARRDIGDILPGVAIAISLVPPLCVVGVAIEGGDWDDALGAFLLFATNVLAMVVVGVALYSALGWARSRRGDTSFRPRPVYAVLGVASAVVVAALGVVTYRTVELSNWRARAQDVASTWARAHGEHAITTSFDGDTLVVLVEGTQNGSDDAELLGLLKGKVPAGTPVDVNRVTGERHAVGKVP